MSFQPDPDRIVWRLHLAAAPDRVFDVLDSADGRAAFWAEAAPEIDGAVQFEFVNGHRWVGQILRRRRPEFWSVNYFGSTVEFELHADGEGGTDLTLVDLGVAPEDRFEVTAGWLNVLLPLKAWIDHGVDLHNHDPDRSWDQAYVDH